MGGGGRGVNFTSIKDLDLLKIGVLFADHIRAVIK